MPMATLFRVRNRVQSVAAAIVIGIKTIFVKRRHRLEHATRRSAGSIIASREGALISSLHRRPQHRPGSRDNGLTRARKPVFASSATCRGLTRLHLLRDNVDLLDTATAYFAAGMNSNEFCVWAISEPITETDAKNALRLAIPDIEGHLAAGRIELIQAPIGISRVANSISREGHKRLE
jgi:hypothetical protein